MITFNTSIVLTDALAVVQCLNRSFAKAYMPHETRDVTMLNMAGNKWTVKWLYKDSGSGFSGGWRGFSLDHRLEEYDVIVLEVVDQENFVILVHIFRVIGAPKEDTGNYRPTPGKARNASLNNKRKMMPENSRAGPSSSQNAKCSKVENLDHTQWQTPPKVELPSCSKRAPKTAAKLVLGIPAADFETHKGKKVKPSPTTSCEVYAEYTSFVTPPPDDVIKGADLDVRPLFTKQAEAGDSRETLLKLGKELATAKSASPSSSSASDGCEKMQTVSPSPDKDLNVLPETCACVA